MIVFVALTIGLIVWIIGWALGYKSFDVFMLTATMVVVAASARVVLPFVKQRLGRDQATRDRLGPPTAPGSSPS